MRVREWVRGKREKEEISPTGAFLMFSFKMHLQACRACSCSTTELHFSWRRRGRQYLYTLWHLVIQNLTHFLWLISSWKVQGSSLWSFLLTRHIFFILQVCTAWQINNDKMPDRLKNNSLTGLKESLFQLAYKHTHFLVLLCLWRLS